MDPARWERLERLLERAGAIPDTERAAFLDREAGDDPELHAELSALLAASDGAEEFVGRLRNDVLGTGLDGVVRDAADAGELRDPWIGRTVSHYEIFDRIGGGGMGVVYLARDVDLDRQVALKFIAPELRRDSGARRRFLAEARAASALDHPNICTIHEIAEDEDGRPFIVMTAYEGETLRERLERGTPTDAEALDIACQIARALAAAHERGIVHRDVKPDNVLITRDGVVKLLDFGLARTADGGMSGSGTIEGTVAYMSPEQARGARADERSDVWALGVILFEMLAGRRPFAAADARATVDLILTVAPDLRAVRPDLPPGTVRAVERALSGDPPSRFANGGQLLESLLDAGSATTSIGGPRAVHRRRALWVAGAAAGLVVVVVAASLRDRVSGRPDPAAAGVSAPAGHVLWVDDDPQNNRFIIEQFTDRGVEVTTVLDTEEALARFDPELHHLVISDMGRYEGSDGAYVARAGLHVLEGLRARDEDVQVVFCTSARAVDEYREEALAAGARDIVTDCEVFLRLFGIEPRSPP